jgi:protein TonB
VQRPRREGFDSAPHTRSHSDVDAVDVIVLTDDATLLATLQEAAGVGHRFRYAASIEASVELLLGGRCGILIIDAAVVGNELARLTEKLQAQFPEVVLLATGQRSDQNAIASLVASGRIYRFLHKPVSPARAELFLSAATRRYVEIHHTESRGTHAALRLSNPRARNTLIAATLALVVAVIAWTLWPSNAPEPTAAEPPAQPGTMQTQNDTAAQAELDRRVAAAELVVAQALEAKDAAKATLAFATLQRLDPAHPRLDALQAQLISLARSSIAPPAKTPPAAQQAARVQAPRPTPHLDVAKAFLAANQLVEPIEANALGQLRQARAAGENPSAVQIAATDLGTRLINRAVAATNADDVQEAKRAYQAAAEVDREFATSLPDLDAAGERVREIELAAERRSAAAERLARATRLRMNGRLIEPAGDNAYEALKQILAESTATSEVRDEQRRLSLALLDNTRTALAAGNVDLADVLATRAEEILPGLTQTKTLRQQIGAARTERDDRDAVVQAATLTRKREVPAVYPRDALLDNIEGWVDLEFVIDAAGVPTDIVVKSSRPQRVFDAAALYALRQWRFEPLVRDGAAQARRAALRMEFKLKQ